MALTWMQIVQLRTPPLGADVRLVLLAALALPPSVPTEAGIASTLGYATTHDRECLRAILSRLARLGWTVTSGRVSAPATDTAPEAA